MKKDLAASVRARLLAVAKSQGADFNQVLVRFALERLLYRLSQSAHADRFLLKGALLFTLWYDMPHRPTRDADLLGFGPSDLESIGQTFRDIASVAVEDGITFDPAIASTMMACEQPVMDQETAYLKMLPQAKTYAVKGDQLTLMDASNTVVATYKAQTQDLSGTNWEVIGYNNGKQAVTSVIAGTTLTASFGKDGNLSGNAGCNNYNGPYKVNGSQITIGPLASTMKACADPAGVMDQEAQYLAALGTAATYQVENNVLELRTKDGALAADFSKK